MSAAIDEHWAQRFHEVYEWLAPQFGYETRADSRARWEDVPAKNRRLMISTVGIVRREIEAEALL